MLMSGEKSDLSFWTDKCVDSNENSLIRVCFESASIRGISYTVRQICLKG